jgi:proteasome assembly chaperone (PAC2) family protein
VIDYINRKLGAISFCEIEPAGFFALDGVAVQNDTARFPEGKFYAPQRKDLVTFKGNEPQFQRYKFLDGLCDLARYYCKVRQLYTLGGTISPVAHTGSRRILAVFNQEQIQHELSQSPLMNMNWQGPPAMSSFLLWAAHRKAIPGVSLWTEIPFYLAEGKDLQAIKATLSFLDKKFDLALDFAELDEQIEHQNAKIRRLRQDDAQIDRCIEMLEARLSLTADEQVELSKKVADVLENG